MQVEFKTDELVPCMCGFKPDHYTVGYGRTPYCVFCPVCKKQTSFAKCLITGSHLNLVDYWNKHISQLTLAEMKDEVAKFERKKKRKDPYNEAREYAYYWYKGKGPVLYESY